MFTLQLTAFTALAIVLQMVVCIMGRHNEQSRKACLMLQILPLLFMHSVVNVSDRQLQFFPVTLNNECGEQVFMPDPGYPSSPFSLVTEESSRQRSLHSRIACAILVSFPPSLHLHHQSSCLASKSTMSAPLPRPSQMRSANLTN